MLSPLPTPGAIGSNNFVNTTPMSGFDQIRPGSDGSDTGASPRYMMDWAHMAQFGHSQQYQTMARSDLIMGSGMNPGIGLSMDGMVEPSEATMLSMIPDFTHALPPVTTPIATPPRLEGAMSDIELGAAASMYHASRQHSVSTNASGDIHAVVTAQDGWNCFRSAPTIPPNQCPRTARLHLEKLERTLKNHDLWREWRSTFEDQDAFSNSVKVVAPHESSRDKLLAITQTFLHKALEIHRDGSLGTPPGGATPCSMDSAFVLLPPARVLQSFLQSYANSFDRFFPMTSRGVLDINEKLMDQSINDKAATLLTLLMIAHGAANIPSLEARWLTGGLTEACRISLFDLIEKNIGMASNRTVLQSGLLLTASAAWSGDKWQMDIAMGQRGMYFAMLRHSGILDPTRMMTPPATCGTPEALWTDWLEHESSSRYDFH
jgi:hypothetical protein